MSAKSVLKHSSTSFSLGRSTVQKSYADFNVAIVFVCLSSFLILWFFSMSLLFLFIYCFYFCIVSISELFLFLYCLYVCLVGFWFFQRRNCFSMFEFFFVSLFLILLCFCFFFCFYYVFVSIFVSISVLFVSFSVLFVCSCWFFQRRICFAVFLTYNNTLNSVCSED
jgi:hypothetical protein